jgi:hypothetical protein
MKERGFGENLCSGSFVNRGPDQGKEGSHLAPLSRVNQQTHHVAAVGSFGPTNFISQRQSVGRLRVVRGGGSCVHPLQNRDLHLSLGQGSASGNV